MSFQLPKMEFSFDVAVNGNQTNVAYTGTFIYKRPTIGDRSRIDVMNKRLNGDLLTLENETMLFNEAISHLRFTLIEYPEWWKAANLGMDLYDANVVVEIYNKCVDFEEVFMKRLHSKDGERINTDEKTEEIAMDTPQSQL